MTAATTRAAADSGGDAEPCAPAVADGPGEALGDRQRDAGEQHDPGLEQRAHDVGGRGVLGAQRLGAERQTDGARDRPGGDDEGVQDERTAPHPGPGPGHHHDGEGDLGGTHQHEEPAVGPVLAEVVRRVAEVHGAGRGRQHCGHCAQVGGVGAPGALAPGRRVDAVSIRSIPVPQVGSCGPWRGPVGEGGFEPPASCSQSRRAAKLRHSPEGVSVPPGRWWSVFGALRGGSRAGVHGVGAPTGTLAGL